MILKLYFHLHYSSLKCHMILQKSFYYADLMLKFFFLFLMLKTIVLLNMFANILNANFCICISRFWGAAQTWPFTTWTSLTLSFKSSIIWYLKKLIDLNTVKRKCKSPCIFYIKYNLFLVMIITTTITKIKD